MHDRVALPDQAGAVSQTGDPRLSPVDREAEPQTIETELRRRDLKLRMALEVGRMGSWERDLATNEISANATCKAHFGLAQDEPLTVERLEALRHPGDAERVDQAISYALATKSDFNVEHRVIRPDGRIGRILVRGGVLHDGGKPVRLVGVTLDITERERVKEEFQAAQRRQEFLLSLNDRLRGSDDPFAIMEATAKSIGQLLKVDCAGYGEINEERGIVLVEREWSRGAISNEGRVYRLSDFVHGLIDESKLGRTLAIEDVRTNPRTGDPALQSFYSTINARAILTVPLLRNGKITAILYVTASSPRAWSGEEISLLEDVANRTWTAVEKARAELSLRESESHFRLIGESLPGMVFMVAPDLSLTYVNDRWIEFSGMTREESLGHGWLSAVHPDDLAKVAADAKLPNPTGELWETEMRYRSAGGVYRWHLVRVASLFGPNGEYKGKIGTSVDIHAIKETETALRKSEERLSLAQRTARIGVFDMDVQSNSVTWTAEQEALFGIEPGTFEGAHEGWTSRVHRPDALMIERRFSEAVARGDREMAFTYRIPLPDGTFRNIEGTMVIFYGPDGSATRVVGVNIDVTKHKQAEERQQLLIRELHHRVKNTLATVQAIVGSTARTASSIDEFYQGFVGRIVSLARTHNLLTEDLWQKASLEELIQTELGPYQDEARNHVTVEGPPLELPSEAAVPIGMAIHELTTNAAKHGALSTFGGQVEVRWRIEPGERPLLHFSWSEQGGPHVAPPARQGFGSRLLQRVLTTQLQAQVSMDFRPEGLRFTMTMPIPSEPPLFNPDK